MADRPDEPGSTGRVGDPVRTAELLVSATWLVYLEQAEQTLAAGIRACRHMRENAEARLRSALVTGNPARIVAAQGGLETARADEAVCQSELREMRALLDAELALRGLTVRQLADSPDGPV